MKPSSTSTKELHGWAKWSNPCFSEWLVDIKWNSVDSIERAIHSTWVRRTNLASFDLIRTIKHVVQLSNRSFWATKICGLNAFIQTISWGNVLQQTISEWANGSFNNSCFRCSKGSLSLSRLLFRQFQNLEMKLTESWFWRNLCKILQCKNWYSVTQLSNLWPIL